MHLFNDSVNSFYEKYFVSLYRGLLDLIYPRICIVCEEEYFDHSISVCEQCQKKIQPLPRESFLKKEQPENLDSLFISFLFNDYYQTLIHHLKYKEYQSLGEWIGEQMATDELIQKFKNKQAILVPVPLHKIRYRERGYNQAELIAKGLAEKIDLPMKNDILKRVKNTRSQTNLSKEERIINMKNAFTAYNKVSRYELIILVDDVFTTGTTMNSAAKALRKSGARNIAGWASAAPKS